MITKVSWKQYDHEFWKFRHTVTCKLEKENFLLCKCLYLKQVIRNKNLFCFLAYICMLYLHWQSVEPGVYGGVALKSPWAFYTSWDICQPNKSLYLFLLYKVLCRHLLLLVLKLQSSSILYVLIPNNFLTQAALKSLLNVFPFILKTRSKWRRKDEVRRIGR